MSAKARIMATVAVAGVLFGPALARADSLHNTLSLSTTSTGGGAGQPLQPVHKTLQWDNKGRWSLKLDLSESAGRSMELRDVQAGAYYHLTPSLRVGGAVSLGDGNNQLIDRNTLPQSQAPRVKLETTFKF